VRRNATTIDDLFDRALRRSWGAVIADPAKADKRTRSKWSRVMRYAAAYKPFPEPLIGSSSASAASTPALPGSPGVWVEIRRCGDGQQQGDEAIISTNRRWLPVNEDAISTATRSPAARSGSNGFSLVGRLFYLFSASPDKA